MNKVVLITGAAKRVGASIATIFHAANYRVIVHYRHSKSEAERLVATFNEQRPHSAACIAADLDVFSTYETLIQESAAIFGQLDSLINNASSFFKTPMGKITEENWNHLFNSNLKAPLFLSQAAQSHLKKSNGNIINIIDIQKPVKDYTVYSCAKAGLLMLTKSLALEFSPNIRVNAIGPGHVIWPENNEAFSEAQKKKVLEDTLLHKNVAPEDIGKTALFLAEQDSINAQMVCVDGGRL